MFQELYFYRWPVETKYKELHWGLTPGIFECGDLFEVLDTRDGRKSTVVISQFPVSTWFDMFADNTYSDACLTRITDKHHTYRLEMNGIDMRETE